MDKFKRYELVNQLLILEKLYPDQAEDFSNNRKALEGGYELHYSWMMEHIRDELSTKQCEEVLDILDMYCSIALCWQRLHNSDEIPHKLRFKGFDGNHEIALLGYAQHIIIDLERFRELTYGNKAPHLNSHMPMLEQYKRMVKIWKKLGSHLNEDRINKIIEA